MKYTHAFHLGVCHFFFRRGCVHIGQMDCISSILSDVFLKIILSTRYRCIDRSVPTVCAIYSDVQQWRLTQISAYIHVPFDHAVFIK